ncbi:MAG: hypothetical protein CMG64_00815 [Candidatus Marinimicrobia bacterium]|nr:hypothetical protein [Candidatus Neomarinimicrobiota bacterium]|tara:strand:- start:1297 stop:1800 length:504 start_codon:yes stop_codon:yes gene_type:complete
MQNNFLQILPWAKYLLGLSVYFVFISQQQLSVAIIWFVFVVYGWTILSIIFKTYKLQDFVYVVCFSGIVVAITLFFMNGVEEVPFPKGAVQFKADGIAQSLLLFFIFTLPLILYSQKDPLMLENNEDSHVSINTEDLKPSEKVHRDQWEEATQDDLDSGKYELSDER